MKFCVTYEIPDSESEDRLDQIISWGVLRATKDYLATKLDGREVRLPAMDKPVLYEIERL